MHMAAEPSEVDVAPQSFPKNALHAWEQYPPGYGPPLRHMPVAPGSIGMHIESSEQLPPTGTRGPASVVPASACAASEDAASAEPPSGEP